MKKNKNVDATKKKRTVYLYCHYRAQQQTAATAILSINMCGTACVKKKKKAVLYTNDLKWKGAASAANPFPPYGNERLEWNTGSDRVANKKPASEFGRSFHENTYSTARTGGTKVSL